MRINSVEELHAHHAALKNQVKSKYQILTCGGPGCIPTGGAALLERLQKLATNEPDIEIVPTGCFGFCEQGPMVKILPGNTVYVKVKEEDAEEIIESTKNEQVIDRLLYEGHRTQDEIPFYQGQVKIALRNCGEINPESLDDYISKGGYLALAKSLTELNPIDIVEQVKQSGLRGRGGGGFPTGIKWELTAKNVASANAIAAAAALKTIGTNEKEIEIGAQTIVKSSAYVVCNADEGDPGAFMDRSIMEGDPHSIVEAMAICGRAIGANEGLIYVRAEYPIAVERLTKAIYDATDRGLLGENILNTGFDFTIRIKLGAGAFVCGEETSLMNSVQGGRGEPRVKPPFPAESGIWSKPTNINNVETYANIPPIILNGAGWFSKIGTEKSKGTKVFSLAGKINNVGLCEVPIGTPLSKVIYDIGGGIKNNKKLKAVQTGGPSGGCIPADKMDMAIDYETLSAIGSMMGSGGMIVMDEDDCMVDVAKFFLEFTMDESCGKCTPCRIGNLRLYEMLKNISEGQGSLEDLETLKNLSETIKDTALCGLGQSSPNPVLSSMRYFEDEYKAHVENKQCPAGKCQAMITYRINPEKCVGCTACARVCPVPCIEGEVKKTHKIIQEKCIKCGSCYKACKFNAVEK